MSFGDHLYKIAGLGMLISYAYYLYSGIQLVAILSCFFLGAFGMLAMITEEFWEILESYYNKLKNFLFLLGAGEGA